MDRSLDEKRSSTRSSSVTSRGIGKGGPTLSKISRKLRNLKLKFSGKGTGHEEDGDPREHLVWFEKGLEEEVATDMAPHPPHPLAPTNNTPSGLARSTPAPGKPGLAIDTEFARYGMTSCRASQTSSQSPTQEQPFDLNEWLQRPPTPVPAAEPTKTMPSGSTVFDATIKKGIRRLPEQEVPYGTPWIDRAMAVPVEAGREVLLNRWELPREEVAEASPLEPESPPLGPDFARKFP